MCSICYRSYLSLRFVLTESMAFQHCQCQSAPSATPTPTFMVPRSADHPCTVDILQLSVPATWRPIYTSDIKYVFCWQTATWRARRLRRTQMASTCWRARIARVHENSARYLWRGKMDLVLPGTEQPYLHFLVSYTCMKRKGAFRLLGDKQKQRRCELTLL